MSRYKIHIKNNYLLWNIKALYAQKHQTIQILPWLLDYTFNSIFFLSLSPARILHIDGRLRIWIQLKSTVVTESVDFSRCLSIQQTIRLTAFFLLLFLLLPSHLKPPLFWLSTSSDYIAKFMFGSVCSRSTKKITYLTCHSDSQHCCL